MSSLKKKGVSPETIEAQAPEIGKSGSYTFEKTKDYFLTHNQLITVRDNYIAKLYFKYDNPRVITKCSDKKITKAARLRGDRNGEEFFVIFESRLTEQNNGAVPQTWGVGSVPVKSRDGEYHVGTKGFVKIKLTDSKKFIDVARGGQPGVYSSVDVFALVIHEVEQKAEEILGSMFKNVSVFLQDAVYLTDEYNLRLENHFFSDDEPFSRYGIQLLELKADTISVSRYDVGLEKDRLSELAAQEEAERREAALRKKRIEDEKLRRAREEEKRRMAEEELREQAKKIDAAKQAESAANRAASAATEALFNATQFINLAKKSEQDAINRALDAEKRAEEYEKRNKELEKLLNAYRAAHAATRSAPAPDSSPGSASLKKSDGQTQSRPDGTENAP